MISRTKQNDDSMKTMYPEIRSLALESHRVLFRVRRFIACTPNLLVTLARIQLCVSEIRDEPEYVKAE